MRLSHNLLAGNPGGTIDCVGSWMVLQHNTFVDDRGSAAVVVETESQHYSSSRITDNVFAGPKEYAPFIKPITKPAPVVERNGVPPGASGMAGGAGNLQANPQFIDASVRGDVVSRSFDPARFVTTVTLKAGEFKDDELRGRVVNIGERWSVVRSNDGRTIQVWGDLTGSDDAPLLIQATYRQTETSPCRDLGAYAAGPATVPAK
jgi:hypothetical protein